MFYILLQAWDKEKTLSPHEELNLKPSDSTLWCSITEPKTLYGEQGLSGGSYDTHPAYCKDQ